VHHYGEILPFPCHASDTRKITVSIIAETQHNRLPTSHLKSLNDATKVIVKGIMRVNRINDMINIRRRRIFMISLTIGRINDVVGYPPPRSGKTGAVLR
ncbi:MAG: hypothetical protein ACKPKO_21680, partial [Candidatus Fonsibacter sp.]